jgi:signal transduction histidine kinase
LTVTIRAMATAAPPTAQRRRRTGHPRRTGSRRLAVGVALLVLAALLAARQLGLLFSDAIVWPVVLAASGLVLIWRQWGGRGVPASPPANLRTAPQAEAARQEERAALRTLYRGGFGVALIVGAGLLFLYANGALSGLGDVALTALVAIVALGLILAPFWSRLARTLAAERAARIRSEERAEVAAHLHDSVLQTLALVQQRSEDPKTVATLARRQERELREWLRGRPPVAAQAQDSFAAALELAAEEIEEAHGARIDVVAVGDRRLDEHTRAVVAAAREALTNAAKFAGDEAPVSVYAEASPERVQVFVRDRGRGFDASAVPPDRRGVRDSIVGRMARHGGRGTVTSAPGAGTEVELTLERPGA